MLFLHSGNYYLVNKIIHVILAKTFFSYKIFYFMRNKIQTALFFEEDQFNEVRNFLKEHSVKSDYLKKI